MDYSKRAKELFESGYNCSQAVLLAFEDKTGLDKDTATKLASSFGGGIGRMREVCGAVSGMCMVAGLIYGPEENTDGEKKANHYKLIQDLSNQFKEETGSIICRQLLGLDSKEETYVPEKRTKEYYQKRPCGDMVALAAKIMEEYMRED